MYYGVEQSTDLRCRMTVIKKFSSLKAALLWSCHSGGYTYGDPESARNYHRTFRRVYMHIGRVNKRHSAFFERGTRDYPMDDADRMANYLTATCDEIMK